MMLGLGVKKLMVLHANQITVSLFTAGWLSGCLTDWLNEKGLLFPQKVQLSIQVLSKSTLFSLMLIC